MPDEFSFNISGIEEACAMLDRVPKETAKVGIARALAAAAVPIVQAVEAVTPEITGDLKKALRTDIGLDTDSYGGYACINFGNQGHVANWVEYGHRMIGHKALGKLRDIHEPVVPHPFMRPAAAASGEAAVDAFTETLGRELASGTTWADVAESAA
jgi:hypothetical protein